jgi:hypothetical protein
MFRLNNWASREKVTGIGQNIYRCHVTTLRGNLSLRILFVIVHHFNPQDDEAERLTVLVCMEITSFFAMH